MRESVNQLSARTNSFRKVCANKIVTDQQSDQGLFVCVLQSTNYLLVARMD